MKIFSKLLSVMKKKVVISVVTIIAFAAFVGVVSYEMTKAQVTVNNNGEVTTIRTHAKTVGEVLANLNIEATEHDKLSHSKDDEITSEMEIYFEQAKQITVSIDGNDQDYYSTAETVGEFLKENDFDLNEHDEMSVKKDESLENGLVINIKKAFQVTVNDGGQEKQVWTTGGTVGGLLKDQQVELNELDRLEPNTAASLSSDTTITITRVEKVTDIVEEQKDYSVITRNDHTLEKGKRKVVSPGKEGVVAKHYEVTLENGEEVSRELIKEEVKQDSEKRIVAVGTKVIQNTAATTVSRGDDKVVETLYMEATAYNWNCATCSGTGRTATGYNVKANPNGVIAVDPNVIPLGTRVWVEGYGYAVARDTGGAIKGNRIDVHLPTMGQARSYGRKKVQVKILE
ncbi:G5 and 3D domain-containing protein [Aquibacillus albus]|uniref:Uncharacterized protein YabE (DUF348 family) n=1 Tax=Aquibacillus albus TaxID=1168171 RepID=A0ABS2N4V3_9BACI|nr:G5 and 3D domain-containing protein [Aquibacillus albus]MBM7573138.1 uncharacterized protein YabE (DUF348 family) [Aquibacillus albus]